SGEGIEAWEVLDLLTGLVNKSLVISEAQGGMERYRLSETIRRYARDRLPATGESEAVGGRHRDFYRRQLEALPPEADFPAYKAWCETERDNLRAALAFSLEEPQGAPTALRIG